MAARRRRRYVKRLTNTVIHFAASNLDARRHLVRDFDRRRLALNAACSAARRAIDAVTRSLRLRYPPAVAAPHFPPPSPCGPPAAPTLDAAWRLASAIERAERDLRDLAGRHNMNPPCPYLKLIFVRDSHACYGRAVWYAPTFPASFSKLTDVVKRRLSIPPARRRAITPFERERRRLSRIHKDHVAVLARIRKRFAEASAVIGRRHQEAAQVLVTKTPPSLPRRDVPGPASPGSVSRSFPPHRGKEESS